jgi:hypothetical protein
VTIVRFVLPGDAYMKNVLVIIGKLALSGILVGLLYLCIQAFSSSFFHQPFWLNRLVFYFSIPVVIYLYSVIAFFILRIIFSRWGAPRIFISYKHLYESNARELKKAFEAANFRVEFLEFEAEAKHDQVIHQVQQKIRRSNGVVVIPDAQKSSFVDAEIMAATALRKPVVILRHTDQQKLPDTAYSGFPVFNLDQLITLKYEPLFQYYLYACNHIRHASFEAFSIVSSGEGKLWDTLDKGWKVGFGTGLVLTFLFDEPGTWLYDWLSFLLGPMTSIWRVGAGLLGVALVIAMSLLVFWGRMVGSWLTIQQTLQVARQTFLTGATTYKYLVNAFQEMYPDILKVLERKPLKGAGN